MDKSTLSNYGWIVIVTLVLAVMLALATPFGEFVSNGTHNALHSLIETNEKVVDVNTLTPAIVEMQPIATTITPSFSAYATNPTTPNYIYAKAVGARTISEAFPTKKGVTYVGKPKNFYWATGDIITIYKNGHLLGDYYVIVLGDTTEYGNTGVGDGVIDVLDLTVTSLTLSGFNDPTGSFMMAADVDRNGVIDKKDDAIMKKILLEDGSGIEYTKAYNYIIDNMVSNTTTNIFNQHETVFYESIYKAMVDINNDNIGKNAILEPSDAGAIVYRDDYENINVSLLKNTTLTKSLPVNKSVHINLLGKVLTFRDVVVGVDIKNSQNLPLHVKIDGSPDGSTIESYNYTAVAVAARGANITVDIDGGNYIARSFATNVDENYCGPNGSKYQVRALHTVQGTMNVTNVNIITSADNGNAYGIINQGTLNIKNSKIYADAKYSDDGYNYIYLSVGIQGNGPTIVKNCDITGTHSAISSYNTLYVNGGTYQSVGHGGIYVSGAGNTCYIYHASMKAIAYDGQYEVKPETTNNVGFYIGGGPDESNITVFINGCEFYGTRAPLALRGTSGEQNNTLYISNSRIYGNSKIRIDSDTHTLYLGKNNNFTAQNTTNPSRVIETNKIYTVLSETEIF